MKNSIFKKIMLGTLLATTLTAGIAPSVLAKKVDADRPLLALANSNDEILLKGDISLTKKDEKVSLSLRDSDVEQVLRMFADIAGLNIVFYDKVSSKITLDLVDEPVSSAFDMVMEISGLNYAINGKTLIITKMGNSNISITKPKITFVPLKYVGASTMANFLNKNIFAQKKPGLAGTEIVTVNPATNELMVYGTDNDVSIVRRVVERFDVKPTFTTFKLNFTTPKEMSDMICKMLLPTILDDAKGAVNYTPWTNGTLMADGGFITGAADTLNLGEATIACSVVSKASGGQGMASIDTQSMSISYQEQNGLINMIGGSAEQIAMVGDFIKRFDRKIPQAYLELSVVELSETGSKSLTNTWSFYSNVFSFNAVDGGIGTNLPIWFFGESMPTYDGSSQPPKWDMLYKYTGAGEKRPTSAALQYTVNYALKNNKARTVANPRVIITNGEESSIDLTATYVESVTTEMTASGTGTFATRTYNLADDAGVKVTVTPYISPDGYVTMNISPEYTVIGEQMTETDGVNTYPTATLTNTRSVDLKNIRLKDGETLVIAGMIMETETKNVSKIPGLGDIPYLGMLFRSSSTDKSKNELLIMLTPKIIYDDEDL